MKQKPVIIISLLVIGLIIIGSIIFFLLNPGKSSYQQQSAQPTPAMSESDKAIAKIKSKYPDLADYPSDLLPPKSIRYAQVNGTWYIAFIQEGSGVPIISAKCFTIDSADVITLFSEFTPQKDSVLTNPFSPIACKPL